MAYCGPMLKLAGVVPVPRAARSIRGDAGSGGPGPSHFNGPRVQVDADMPCLGCGPWVSGTGESLGALSPESGGLRIAYDERVLTGLPISQHGQPTRSMTCRPAQCSSCAPVLVTSGCWRCRARSVTWSTWISTRMSAPAPRLDADRARPRAEPRSRTPSWRRRPVAWSHSHGPPWASVSPGRPEHRRLPSQVCPWVDGRWPRTRHDSPDAGVLLTCGQQPGCLSTHA